MSAQLTALAGVLTRQREISGLLWLLCQGRGEMGDLGALSYQLWVESKQMEKELRVMVEAVQANESEDG